MPNRFFATDCEGPLSKNDNALELAGHFLPNGETFFAKISKYDDFLADVEKRPGYRAGDTLKLILPFFKAYGSSEKALETFSSRNILLLPQAQETLRLISSLMPCYIISTSYNPYIRSLCRAIDFPVEFSFSTSVPLDAYSIKKGEQEKLKILAEEINSLPTFSWPASAQGLDDLSPADGECIRRLNRIFWEEIAGMELGRLLTDIRPVGGEEKALALKTIAEKHRLPLREGFYVGDSITDVQAFQEIDRAGGITLSFNGNAYAVREARLACLSSTTLPMAILAEAFSREGADGVFDLALNWEKGRLVKKGVRSAWLETLFPEGQPPASELFLLTPENRDEVTRKSSQFRKEVRGEVIGGLG